MAAREAFGALDGQAQAHFVVVVERRQPEDQVSSSATKITVSFQNGFVAMGGLGAIF